jgi:uncharacterized protein (TIGR00730 family)
MKSICVFCGSSSGRQSLYLEQARAFGQVLATEQIDLVYGGSKNGLMGAVADAVLEAGGHVTGVIPGFLKHKEIGHDKIQRLITVQSMHERKSTMANLSEGFVMLPGGVGTLEEFFEILTWGQLGLHPHPIGILNIGGYYDKLMDFLTYTQEEDFVKEVFMKIVLVDQDPAALIAKMRAYTPPKVNRIMQHISET